MTYEQVYNFLVQKRHIINSENINNLFADTYTQTPNSGHEYWLVSDLLFLMNANNVNITPEQINEFIYRHFETIPVDRCTNHHEQVIYQTANSTLYDAHIVKFNNKQILTYTPDHQPTRTHGSDFRISRYACYFLCSGVNHSEFLRFYFLRPDLTTNELRKFSHEFARINLRQTSKYIQKTLGGIIQSHHASHSKIQHKLHNALYGGMTQEQIKMIKQIKPKANDPLLNYADATTLFAYNIALRKAIKTYEQSGKNFSILVNSLPAEIKRARVKIVELTGHAPEHNISTTPITKLESELRKIESKFITEYGNKKIR